MTPTKFTEVEYVTLNHQFSGGDISACSKAELERFAVMLSRPSAFTQFDAHSFPQICETVRTLILVRMSEEQNVQANRESRLALIIACTALLVGTVQTAVALWSFVFPSPTLVQASTPLAIHVASPIPVYSVPRTPVLQTPAASAPKPK